MADERPVRIFTRRDLLRAGVATAAAAVPTQLFASAEVTVSPEPAQIPPAAPREAFENLTAAEADLLEAIVARLIPSDALGPGAKEARAAHYIDRALGGALASNRQAYEAGLAALDRHSRSSKGKTFTELATADQDSVLSDVETGVATGFTGGSGQFFNMVLGHTHQGTFGDPYYGGNASFVGWDLIGYPGVRTMVTPADQQALERGQLKPTHKSAYDFEAFNKATVSNGFHGDTSHAD
jgi:gluconate 2-dehydrogenase gamma chain